LKNLIKTLFIRVLFCREVEGASFIFNSHDDSKLI
jgi:hypothetical protein